MLTSMPFHLYYTHYVHFADVGKMEKVFDRTAKVIYSLFINIVIYPLAVSNSNCPELADTKGFLFA